MPRFSTAILTTAGETLAGLKIPQGESYETAIEQVHQLLTEALGTTLSDHHGDGLNELLSTVGWYGPLQALLEDEAVTSVMINSPVTPLLVEKAGKVFQLNLALSTEWIRFIVARFRQRRGFTETLPARYTGTLSHPPLRYTYVSSTFAVSGDSLYIRKFRRYPLSFEDQIRSGTMTRELAQFLSGLVRGRSNILVSGGSGAGKTTLMNTLGLAIPPHERVIAVEDEHEIHLLDIHPNFTAYELNPDEEKTTMSDLLRHIGLKVGPHRVMVGEVRGKEAFDLMQAMNTGIDGSMATIHANSASDALKKWADYVAMAETKLPPEVIYSRIADVKPVVVQISRLPSSGRRIIAGVVECLSASKTTFETATLFTLEGDKTIRTRTPFSNQLADRLAGAMASEPKEE